MNGLVLKVFWGKWWFNE